MRDILNELSSKGACVFLNSHILSEIEVTCRRVAFIKQGEVKQIINMEALEKTHPKLRIQGQHFSLSLLDGLHHWAKDIVFEGETLTMQPLQEEYIPSIIHYLVQHGVGIHAVLPQRPTLEELFIQIVGKESEA